MKAQVSLELLITVGIVLAFTIPVLFLLLSLTSVGYEKTAKAQAEASARSLADSMDVVYAQGNGAKKVILLNTPASTQKIYASSGEVVISIKTATGISDAAWPTFAKISSGSKTIEGKTGLFLMSIENDGGMVKLVDPHVPS